MTERQRQRIAILETGTRSAGDDVELQMLYLDRWLETPRQPRAVVPRGSAKVAVMRHTRRSSDTNLVCREDTLAEALAWVRRKWQNGEKNHLRRGLYFLVREGQPAHRGAR